MKRRWIVAIAVGVIGVLAWLASNTSTISNSERTLSSLVTLKFDEHRYETRVAQTPNELQTGLSGSKELGRSQAMLFVFPYEERWGIWMKDMNYPIDIVWLDANRKVIYMVADAQPKSYPDTTYRPQEVAMYVVELRAGTIKDTRITIGAQAVF